MTFSPASQLDGRRENFVSIRARPAESRLGSWLNKSPGLISSIALVLVSGSRNASAFWIVGVFGIAIGYDAVGARGPCSRDVYEVTVPRGVFKCLERRRSRNGTFRASSSIPCVIMAVRG